MKTQPHAVNACVKRSSQRSLRNILFKAEWRQSFSTCVYCMQLSFQSNYLGLIQPLNFVEKQPRAVNACVKRSSQRSLRCVHTRHFCIRFPCGFCIFKYLVLCYRGCLFPLRCMFLKNAQMCGKCFKELKGT